jgi:hypothetical protein
MNNIEYILDMHISCIFSSILATTKVVWFLLIYIVQLINVQTANNQIANLQYYRQEFTKLSEELKQVNTYQVS